MLRRALHRQIPAFRLWLAQAGQRFKPKRWAAHELVRTQGLQRRRNRQPTAAVTFEGRDLAPQRDWARTWCSQKGENLSGNLGIFGRSKRGPSAGFDFFGFHKGLHHKQWGRCSAGKTGLHAAPGRRQVPCSQALLRNAAGRCCLAYPRRLPGARRTRVSAVFKLPSRSRRKLPRSKCTTSRFVGAF